MQILTLLSYNPNEAIQTALLSPSIVAFSVSQRGGSVQWRSLRDRL